MNNFQRSSQKFIGGPKTSSGRVIGDLGGYVKNCEAAFQCQIYICELISPFCPFSNNTEFVEAVTNMFVFSRNKYLEKLNLKFGRYCKRKCQKINHLHGSTGCQVFLGLNISVKIREYCKYLWVFEISKEILLTIGIFSDSLTNVYGLHLPTFWNWREQTYQLPKWKSCHFLFELIYYHKSSMMRIGINTPLLTQEIR